MIGTPLKQSVLAGIADCVQMFQPQQIEVFDKELVKVARHAIIAVAENDLPDQVLAVMQDFRFNILVKRVNSSFFACSANIKLRFALFAIA